MSSLRALASLTALAVVVYASETPRQWGLFSVIQFPNDVCTASSDTTMLGTCMTASECSSKGGSSDGKCAQGFGICCVILKSSCGVTLNQNMSYFTTPSYPQSYSDGTTGVSTCSFFISTSPAICQIRLDFDAFQMSGPDMSAPTNTRNPIHNTCANDLFTIKDVTRNSKSRLLNLCGTASGQHIYVETGSQISTTQLDFKFNFAVTATRLVKARVSMLECNVPWKAPPDCMQYFTGDTGTVQSLAYGVTIKPNSYTTCIRRNQGFCKIQYGPSKFSSPDPFHLTTAGTSPSVDCKTLTVFLIIDHTSTERYGFCGGFFNTYNAIQSMSGVVITDDFNIVTYYPQTDTAALTTGYSLDYAQVAC